jgi:hypothetical protein
MLGILKPLPRLMSSDAVATWRSAHCTTCISIRETYSWSTTLILPAEADFLLTLALADEANAEAPTTRRRCTALPIAKRSTRVLPSQVAESVASFAVLVCWLLHRDHLQDDDHRGLKDRLAGRLTEGRIEHALRVLQLADSPEELMTRVASPPPDKLELQAWLEHHRRTVGGVWRQVIAAVSPTMAARPQWLEALSDSLSDLLVLADGWDDRADDLAQGRDVPSASSPPELVWGELERAATHATMLLKGAPFRLREPWGDIARVTILSVLAKRAKPPDAGAGHG